MKIHTHRPDVDRTESHSLHIHADRGDTLPYKSKVNIIFRNGKYSSHIFTEGDDDTEFTPKARERLILDAQVLAYVESVENPPKQVEQTEVRVTKDDL